MLKKLFALLEADSEPNKPNYSLEVACAVLLCEVMKADGLLKDEELAHVKVLLSKEFPTLADNIEDIIEQAIELSDNANDFYQFTSTINQAFDHSQRINIVSMLWQLAIADGELSSIEEHIIRKIADLLHLRHSEYIQAKNAGLA